MACREPPTFESFVRERLGPHSEAAKMIADLVQDRSLSDAIPIAIQSLPTSKSRELRQIVDLFEPYCEWVEDWEPQGWKVERSGSSVLLYPPKKYSWGHEEHPSSDVIAAASGVIAVRYEGAEFNEKNEPKEVSFRVVR
jgi:hypothetical protein